MSANLPGWWSQDEAYAEPAMPAVDMEPASNGRTGGWQPWDVREGFERVGNLDAPAFIARGGIVVCDGCANATVEREADDDAAVLAAASMLEAPFVPAREECAA